MTKKNLITVSKGTTLDEAKVVLQKHKIEKLLVEVFGLSNKELGFRERPNGSKDEAKAAIDMIRKGAKHIDLKPQASSVRRRQHELVRRAKLVSHSYGVEPNRHVRVFKG